MQAPFQKPGGRDALREGRDGGVEYVGLGIGRGGEDGAVSGRKCVLRGGVVGTVAGGIALLIGGVVMLDATATTLLGVGV